MLPVTESHARRLVDDASGPQRSDAEPLQAVADPVAAELEAVLEMRRSGVRTTEVDRRRSMTYVPEA
jgi:hypothetical protein